VLCMPKSVPPVSAWAQGPAGGMTTVKKLKVIVNPNAGVKKGASNLAICKKVWEAKGIEVIVVHTTHAGHAREIGRDEDLTGIDALVAIGGDGTLHETINGFLSRDTPSDVALGFIPGGSGNSIMAHFGTWDIKEAAERISNGETNRMDINTVTTCGETVVSVNLIAFGLVGTSGVLAEDYRCLGPARYNIVALWKILTGISEATKCELQDETGKTLMIEDNLTTLYLNKTQHFGKGLRAAPFAKMGNGLMELYGLRSGTVTRGGQIAVLQQLPAGAHQSNPAILYKQCSKCVVTLPGAGVFNVDGEVLRHDGTVTVACHKERLKVFAPRDAFPHLL
jgi:diacylglycerol kinase (ATP)